MVNKQRFDKLLDRTNQTWLSSMIDKREANLGLLIMSGFFIAFRPFGPICSCYERFYVKKSDSKHKEKALRLFLAFVLLLLCIDLFIDESLQYDSTVRSYYKKDDRVVASLHSSLPKIIYDERLVTPKGSTCWLAA